MIGMRQKQLFLYILKEMLLYFFVCFLFLFFIFFVNNILLLASDVLSKHAPFKDVALLMLYSLPAVIANAAPFAALIGILMGLGRFVSDLEFLSMNALGVSPRFLMLPVLLFGLVVSVVSFFFAQEQKKRSKKKNRKNQRNTFNCVFHDMPSILAK